MQDDFVRSLKKKRTFHLCADDPTKRKGGEFWCIFCTFSPPKREKEGESGGGNSERKHIGDETRAEQHRNTLSVGGCLTPVDPDAVGPRSADGGKGGPLCCSQRRVIQETISAGRGGGEGGGEGIFVRAKLAFVFLFLGLMHRSIVDREVWNWCRLLLGGGVKMRIKGIVLQVIEVGSNGKDNKR